MIENLFGILLFISLVCLIAGLVKPSLFNKIFKREVGRKKVSIIFGISTILFFFLTGVFAPKIQNQNTVVSPNNSEVVTENTVAEQPRTETQKTDTTKPAETPKVETPKPTEQTSPGDKQKAQKELDDVMALAKQANLATSYEFSGSASVVYIGDTWYTQTVQFKKDFMAKIGGLKKQITGYYNFQVRDAYSNEKVGEITAFGSLEVYK